MKKLGENKKLVLCGLILFPVFLPPVNMSQEDDMNDILFHA